MAAVNVFLASQKDSLQGLRFLMHSQLGTERDTSFFVILEMVNLIFRGCPFHHLLRLF